MAATNRLKVRIERVAEKAPKPKLVLPDLYYLSGREIDRLQEIGSQIADLENHDPVLMKEYAWLVNKCPTLPEGEEFRIRPRFPSSLLGYWRQFGYHDPRFPRGYYSKSNMSYHTHDRLQELAEQYGWNPTTGKTSKIVNIEDWSGEDFDELIDLLWDCLSDSEQKLAGNWSFWPNPEA